MYGDQPEVGQREQRPEFENGRRRKEHSRPVARPSSNPVVSAKASRRWSFGLHNLSYFSLVFKKNRPKPFCQIPNPLSATQSPSLIAPEARVHLRNPKFSNLFIVRTISKCHFVNTPKANVSNSSSSSRFKTVLVFSVFKVIKKE